MTNLNPTLSIEQSLSEQIYNALQGDVVESILAQARLTSSDVYWRSNMEGHSLKVEKKLLKDLYELCYGVKETLGFEEPVDFYVTGDSSVNAFSVAAEEKGQPHIVNINSALIDLMTEDELRFVVGHELGHLINQDTALTRLIHFVFPPDSTVPPVTLQFKIRLWQQLAELVADRYGYMATGDLGVCVSAFFKLASGLDLDKMNVSIDALIEDNYRRLEYFLKGKGVSRHSHPVNPIRVQALNLFATCNSNEELDSKMEELFGILFKIGDSPVDKHLAVFLAVAGLIVANADEQVTNEEVEHIIQSLAALKIFPKDFLERVANCDVDYFFNNSLCAIKELEPGLLDGLFEYMISLALVDKDISDKEIALLYKVGEDFFGYNERQIATKFAAMIQKQFTPSLASIC